MNREVVSDNYVSSHGKPPRGTGSWGFGNKNETKVEFFFGTYTEARKMAIQWADENLPEYETIYVLP